MRQTYCFPLFRNRKIALHWQILFSIILGIVTGLFFGHFIPWIAWMGDLFLRALKMVVLPLIIASVVTGVISLGRGKNLGRIGLKVISFYLITSFLAIICGLLLVNLVKPGRNAILGQAETQVLSDIGNVSFYDTVMGIIPSNLFESLAKGDVLPIIFFSVLFGLFVPRITLTYRDQLTNFFEGFYEVMMKITMLIIRFAPLGIFAIVAGEVAKNSDRLVEVIGSLGLYMLVVISALLFHALVILPLIVKFIGKSDPYLHLKNMSSALLTAFSTSSSSATLPLTIDSVVNKSGVSRDVAGFTLPLGATVNMDGTALYECVAAMFIAQAYGIDLTFGQQIIVVVTALLASVGAAGIPMAGLVMLAVILSAVNLPLEGLGLILAVDRILDMIRTSVNVWSDTCCSVVIARSEGEKLKV